jgi:hypothetical protein
MDPNNDQVAILATTSNGNDSTSILLQMFKQMQDTENHCHEVTMMKML